MDEEYGQVVNVRDAPCDVLIDRTTKWGNPFHIGKDGSRSEVIEKYHIYLKSRPDLLDAIGELTGKVLGCHCHPLPCHGTILLAYAHGMEDFL